MKNQLENDYKTCEKIIRKASKSFYKAFGTLENKEKRQAVYAVYAYCRYSDDIADDLKSKKMLLDLKARLDDFVSYHMADDYIFRTLTDVRSRFYPEQFDFKPYYDMLEGHMMDFNHVRYESITDLYGYCQKVASSVGEMLIYILAPQGDIRRLKKAAYHLGIAMQLTNILRDIGEDYKNGRIYLPRALMKKYGYTTDMLAQGIVNDAFIQIFEDIAEHAYKSYDNAYLYLDAFPIDARKSLHYAMVIYKDIISVCKAASYQVFNKKNRVSDVRKLKLIHEVDRFYES